MSRYAALPYGETALTETREALVAYTNTRWEKRDALSETLLKEEFDLEALKTAVSEAIEADVKVLQYRVYWYEDPGEDEEFSTWVCHAI